MTLNCNDFVKESRINISWFEHVFISKDNSDFKSWFFGIVLGPVTISKEVSGPLQDSLGHLLSGLKIALLPLPFKIVHSHDRLFFNVIYAGHFSVWINSHMHLNEQKQKGEGQFLSGFRYRVTHHLFHQPSPMVMRKCIKESHIKH